MEGGAVGYDEISRERVRECLAIPTHSMCFALFWCQRGRAHGLYDPVDDRELMTVNDRWSDQSSRQARSDEHQE